MSAGVPAADAGGLGAGLSGMSSLSEAGKATQAATESVGNTARDGGQATEQARQVLAGFRPSFISVEVLGFGDGTAGIDEEAERPRRR